MLDETRAQLFRIAHAMIRRSVMGLGYTQEAQDEFLRRQDTLLAQMTNTEIAAQLLIEMPESAFHVA